MEHSVKCYLKVSDLALWYNFDLATDDAVAYEINMNLNIIQNNYETSNQSVLNSLIHIYASCLIIVPYSTHQIVNYNHLWNT